MEIVKPKYIVLKCILLLVICVFGISLFKNLSYPLLWNDESYGAMNATRILEYGYPKVHDNHNNNSVFELPYGCPWKTFYNEKFDVATYATWGNEYLSVPGVFLAKFTDDIYQKTALIRFPFACMGFLSLLVILVAFKDIFPSRKLFLVFSICVFVIELFSVSQILHMREARYYSATLLLAACFFWVFTRYFICQTLKTKTYFFLMAILFFITYHVFYVLDVIFFGTILSWIAGQLTIACVAKKNVRLYFSSCLKAIYPIAASIILIFPFEMFFHTIKAVKILTEFMHPAWTNPFNNLVSIVSYFFQYEFFIAGIIIKVLAIIVCFKIRSIAKTDNNLFEPIRRIMLADLLINVFILIYVILISRSPIYLFTRAFFPILPAWVISLSIEVVFLLYVASQFHFVSLASKRFYGFIVILAMIGNGVCLFPEVKDHAFELFHPYKGPLDFIIPTIIKISRNPKDIIIATNYESTSFMFYLGSRVLIGFTPMSIDEDLKAKPDIVIFRWPSVHQEILEGYLHKGNYKCVNFPVVNYPVNDIPELNKSGVGITHLFRTWYTRNKNQQASIFVSDSLLKSQTYLQ